MESLVIKQLEQTMKSFLEIEDLNESIAHMEEELDDILDSIFRESEVDPNTVMAGDAKILHSIKGGFIIQMDNGKKLFMFKNAYKGSSVEKGTRIQCGRFLENKKGCVCIDAQECLSMNELKYQLFSFIDNHEMAKAASAAWALYKDASDINKEKMKICIHMLRNYIRKFFINT